MRFALFAKIMLAAATLSLALPPARAMPIFSVPGWYQIADTVDGGAFLWRGPFSDKESCEAILPASDDDTEYLCDYIETRPPWDE